MTIGIGRSLVSLAVIVVMLSTVRGLASPVGLAAQTPGRILLLGTGAVSFYGDVTFSVPVLNLLQGNSLLPVLVVNDWGGVGVVGARSGQIVHTDTATFSVLSLATLSSNYSALFFLAAVVDEECCQDPASNGALAGTSDTIAGFLRAGGNLGVEDFEGNDFWDAILGFDAAPGVVDGSYCRGDAISTTRAIELGFAPSYSEGGVPCFAYQAYLQGFWTINGYDTLQVSDDGFGASMLSAFVGPIPAPSPPPPPQPACATPDPFVSLGGGTCFNGGWLPPGMVPPTTPTTPAPTTPPPTGGCATPDPFVTLGGGTCFNGGWLPPGMAPPTTPTAPPPPAAGSCTTPDPFVTLGGGTCFNGGWLPPGLVPPSTPTPPAPTVVGCATPDPFVSIPSLVGICVNGGWMPVLR